MGCWRIQNYLRRVWQTGSVSLWTRGARLACPFFLFYSGLVMGQGLPALVLFYSGLVVGQGLPALVFFYSGLVVRQGLPALVLFIDA